MFGDVLKRSEHNRDFGGRVDQNLCSGGDVWLLPAMHEVPRFTKKLRELSAVEHEMDRPPGAHWNRNHVTRLRRLRLERMPPEIAVEPRRPHCSDVPFPIACELLGKTPVEFHTVRMSDGQETAALELSHAT